MKCSNGRCGMSRMAAEVQPGQLSGRFPEGPEPSSRLWLRMTMVNSELAFDGPKHAPLNIGHLMLDVLAGVAAEVFARGACPGALGKPAAHALLAQREPGLPSVIAGWLGQIEIDSTEADRDGPRPVAGSTIDLLREVVERELTLVGHIVQCLNLELERRHAPERKGRSLQDAPPTGAAHRLPLHVIARFPDCLGERETIVLGPESDLLPIEEQGALPRAPAVPVERSGEVNDVARGIDRHPITLRDVHSNGR